MNRYDWMKILTKGCPPSREKRKKENVQQASTDNHENEDVKKNDVENSSQHELGEETPNTDPHKGKAKIKTKEKLAQLQKEKINHFRNVNNIHVHGADIPPPVTTFEQLTEDYGVNTNLVNNLLKEKYERPTPIQMQAWPLLLKRREVLACAPTGSGKTAAFLVPVIHHLKSPRAKGFRAIILAPTRELARQIVRESDRLTEGSGLKASIIKKGKVSESVSFFKKFDILVTTPNRLIYLLQECKDLENILEKVEWLIIDESDKLFEEGKNGFRDQLATLYRACSGPNVMRGMFSATLSFDVEEWSKLSLDNLATVAIGMRNTCPDVEQSLSFCASNAGKIMEIHEILRKGYEIPCLIFVQTKERAKKLCEEILLTNRPVRCIHSDMSQRQRDEIVQEFRQKKIWILICTELMGRGIDFKGVNLVINYDFPPSIISYVHRIGRTGRAGKKGKAITFWSMEDKPLLRSIGQVMKNSGSEVPDWILQLKSTSTKQRKIYAQNVPDRGDITFAIGDKKKKKRKLPNDNAEGKGKRKRGSEEENTKINKKRRTDKTGKKKGKTDELNKRKDRTNITDRKGQTRITDKTKGKTNKKNLSQGTTKKNIKLKRKIGVK